MARIANAKGFGSSDGTMKSYTSNSRSSGSPVSSSVPALARELFPIWFLVAGLCAAAAGTLVGYEKYFALNVKQQHTFNAVIIGLTIFLALAVESLLSRFASRWKWHFLSRRAWSAHEVSLVMSSESRWAVIKLLLYEFRHKWWQRARAWKIPFWCVVWLLLGLAAQIAIACLGIAYSIAYPQDFASFHAKTVLGTSYVSDLSTIIPSAVFANALFGYSRAHTVEEQREAAHIYGLESSNFRNIRGTSSGSLTVNVVNGLRYLKPAGNENAVAWYYNMTNQDPSFNPSEAVVSPRQVQVSSTCEKLKIISERSSEGFALVEFEDRRYQETRNLNLTVPRTSETYGSTTYATNEEDYWGPRSTRILVIPERQREFLLFSCNITVGPVMVSALQSFEGGGHENYTSQPFLFLPDKQARIFAGAIAWNPVQRIGTVQSRAFPKSSTWAVTGWRYTNYDPYFLGFSYAARFAMGAIAAYDQNARTQKAYGVRSFTRTYLLRPKWRYAAPILGLVPGVLLLLLLITLWWLRDVPVRDDGPFVNTLVLKHVLSDSLSYATKGGHGRVLGEGDLVAMVHGKVTFPELTEAENESEGTEKGSSS